MPGHSDPSKERAQCSGSLISKVTLRHLLVLGVLVAVPALGAGAFAASSVNSFRPAGTIRLASASSSSSVSVDSDTVKKVLSVSISVPSGRHADLQATFSASVHHNLGTFAYCFGSITVDGVPPSGQFKPGLQQLLGGATASEPDAVSAAMTGYRTSVGSGSHTVNVYITPSYAGCTLQERALNVVADIY